jgi:hypothetical protein
MSVRCLRQDFAFQSHHFRHHEGLSLGRNRRDRARYRRQSIVQMASSREARCVSAADFTGIQLVTFRVQSREAFAQEVRAADDLSAQN